MFKESLTNEEFIAATHELNYDTVAKGAIQAIATYAIQRGIPQHALPSPVQEEWLVITAAVKRIEDFDPSAYLEKVGRKLNPVERINIVSTLTFITGQLCETEDGESVYWYFDEGDGYVSLTNGVFFNEAIEGKMAYEIIGLCTVAKIAWFSFNYMTAADAKQEMGDHLTVVDMPKEVKEEK